MICDCCRRDVDDARASFWHADAMVCGECLAQWRDPDNIYTGAGDAASVGNYVRLQHGLPPLAAAFALLLLAGAPDARASRHCLDQAEAGRTWPTQALVKDGDGCWTYDRHPPRTETPVAPPQRPVQVQMREATLADRWADAGMLRLDPPEIEPKRASETPSQPAPLESTRQFALFVWIVLAVTSVVAVATGGRPGGVSRPRWPDQRTPHRIGRG